MVLIFAQMNEQPGARFRVGHAALTMAEYFRDEVKQDVLLLIDNIFRFVQAGAEVSGLLGELPSRVGYQPTMASENASRLTAMQKAEENIEERLDNLNAQFNRQRQNAITEELLDIVAGFEALAQSV